MTKEQRILESWKVNAEAWVDSVQNDKISSRVKTTNQAIISTILGLRPNNVLDIGCGEGWLLRTFSKEGIQTVGMDGSKHLIDQAKELHPEGTYHALTYEDWVKNPTYISEKFDVVVFNFSLLAKNISSLLSVAKQRINQNGVMIIQTVHPFTFGHPYIDHWKEETYSKMGDGYKMAMPWYYRTFHGWIKELNAAGLTLIDCFEPIDHDQLKPQSLILICQ